MKRLKHRNTNRVWIGTLVVFHSYNAVEMIQTAYITDCNFVASSAKAYMVVDSSRVLDDGHQQQAGGLLPAGSKYNKVKEFSITLSNTIHGWLSFDHFNLNKGSVYLPHPMFGV